MVDVYTYYVDSEVTSTPILSAIGNNIVLNGSNYLGPGSSIGITSLLDSGGIGASHFSCDNGGSIQTYQSATNVSPHSISSSTTPFSLTCNIVDLLGNVGPSVSYSGLTDLSSPTVSISPQGGVTITPQTNLTFTSSDDILNGTSSAMIFWDDGLDSWNTSVSFNGSWIGSLSSLNSSLGDGTVSISVTGLDWFGNSQTISVNSLSLNTSIVSTQVNLNLSRPMVNIGNWVGDSIYFTATPPQGGSFTSTFEHSLDSTSGSHSTPQTGQTSWGFIDMDSGQVWLNVTTTDSFGRVVVDVYTYQVDSEVNTLIGYQLTSNTVNVSGIVYSEYQSNISLSNLDDDLTGVGFDYVECSVNSGNYSSVVTSYLPVSGVMGQVIDVEVSCRNVDLFGNIGPITSLSYKIDSENPVVQPVIGSSSYLGLNSLINYSCVDIVGSQTHKIEYGAPGTISAQAGSVINLNGAQPAITQLGLANGLFEVRFYCIDSLGNIGYHDVVNLNYLSNGPTSIMSITSGNSYQNNNGILYFNKQTNLSFAYVSNNNPSGYLWLNLTTNNNTIFSENSTSQVSLELSNYSTGEYVAVIETCSSVYCTVSNFAFYIDDDAPIAPTFKDFTNNAILLNNTSFPVGRSETIEVIIGSDSLSGASSIECNTTTYSQLYSNVFSSISVNPFLMSIINDQSSEYLQCRTLDKVGNPSNWTMVNLISDFTNPTLSLNIQDVGGYYFPSSSLNLNCQDLNGVQRTELLVQSNTSNLISLNLTNNNSYQLQQILLFPSVNQEISITGYCWDNYGNSHQFTLSNLSYISNLQSLDIEFTNTFDWQNTIYVGNGSYFNIEPYFAIGNVSINVSHLGQQILSKNYSGADVIVFDSQDFVNVFQGLTTQSQLTISVSQYIPGIPITKNMNLGLFEKPAEPTINSIDNNILSNGTHTSIEITDSVCNLLQIFINTSQSSTSLPISGSNLSYIMPNGVATDHFVDFIIEDCLGNHNLTTIQFIRDIQTPNISISGNSGVIISPSQLLEVDIVDNHPFEYKFVNLSTNTGSGLQSINACLDSCDFYLSQYLNLNHGQQIQITVNAKTISGEYISLISNFFYDSFVSESYYDSVQSINTSGFNIGQHSEVYIQSNETLSSLCVKILTDSGYTCVNNSNSILWDVPDANSSGILTLEVVAIDAYNNTIIDLLNFSYHNSAPSLNQNYYASTTNGTILLNYSSQFETIVSTDGNYSQISLDGYLYFNSPGVHVFNCSLVDELGNTNLQQVTLQYDITPASIQMSVNSTNYIGLNSTINYAIFEDYSNISTYVFSIDDGSTVCNITYTTNSTILNGNISLLTILNSHSCSAQKNQINTIQLSISVENNLGLQSINSINSVYVGRINDVSISGSNYSVNGNNLQVSNNSQITCYTHHTISNDIQLSVYYAQYNVISMNSIQWVNGSGILQCTAVDILGNIIQKTWNATFLTNDLLINYNVLNSYQNITRGGSNNLQVNVHSAANVSKLDIFVNQNLISRMFSNSTNFSIPTSVEGFYNISFVASNVLGYEVSENFQIFLDNSIPELNITTGSDYVYNDLYSMVITSSNSPLVSFDYYDSGCVNNVQFDITNGSVISDNGTSVFVLINPNSSGFDVLITDCVGWSNLYSLNIVNKNALGNISFYQPFNLKFENNNSFYISTNGSFYIQSSDYLELQLNCLTSIGNSICTKQGNNIWSVELSNVVSNGSLWLEFVDQIGNSETIFFTILGDTEPPECEFNLYGEGNFLYTSSLQGLTVSCSDENSGLSDISTIISGIELSFPTSSMTFSVPASNSVITIQATDNVGNLYQESFTVVLDNVSPSIDCFISMANNHVHEDYYISVGASLSCDINDFVGIQGNFTVFMTSPTFGVELEQDFTDDFSIYIGSYVDGTELRIEIRAEDYFGNYNASTLHLFFDKSTPQLQFKSFDLGQNQMSTSEILHIEGLYLIDIIDINLDYSQVNLHCQNGYQETYTTNISSIEILSSESNRLICGDYFEISLTSVDLAGNQITDNRTVYFDLQAPTIQFTSNCPLFESFVNLMTYDCNLDIYSSDDRDLQPSIAVYLNDNLISQSLMSYSFNLQQLSEGQEYRISIEVTDDVNRIYSENILVIIETQINAALSQPSCQQDNLSCQSNDYYGYDYLITGDTLADFSLMNTFSSASIVSTFAQICPNYQSSCIVFDEYPYLISGLSSGYWDLEYSIVDNYGRQTTGNYTILIDDNSMSINEINVSPNSAELSGSQILLCETCILEIEILSSHKPLIVSNNHNNLSLEKSQTMPNKWHLTAPLSREHFNTADSQLAIKLISANGKELNFVRQITDIGIFSIQPSLAGSEPCFDDTNNLNDETELDIDFICFFSEDDVSQSDMLATNFDIQLPDSTIQISISENFLPIDRLVMTYGPFNTTNSILIEFQLLSATNQELMEYNLEIYSEFYHNPVLIDIGFANKKAFKSEISINSEYSELMIMEDGFIELSLDTDLEVTFAGISNWQSNEFTNLLIQNLERASCELIGTRTVVNSGNWGDYKEGVLLSGIKLSDCKLVGNLGDNNKLTIISEVDWNTSTNGEFLKGDRGIFYRFDLTSITITYKIPILEEDETIRITKGNFLNYNIAEIIDVSPDYQEYADCQGFSSISGSLEESVNWVSVRNCLTQVKDNNGLVSVGLSVNTKFDGLSSTYTVLCYNSEQKIPNDFNQWFVEEYLEDVGCESNQVELAKDQIWQSISIDLLTCDLLCHESGDREGFVFEKSELLDDGYLFRSDLPDIIMPMVIIITFIVITSTFVGVWYWVKRKFG